MWVEVKEKTNDKTHVTYVRGTASIKGEACSVSYVDPLTDESHTIESSLSQIESFYANTQEQERNAENIVSLFQLNDVAILNALKTRHVSSTRPRSKLY